MSDEPTKIIRRGGAGKPAAADSNKTTITPRAGVFSHSDPDETHIMAGNSRDEETVKINERNMQSGGGSSADDNMTQLHRPNRPLKSAAPPAPEIAKAADDPVVGWLVVIDGPGKGNALRLGNYMNHIGRDTTNRVVLNFGDNEISREPQAILTYDQRNRKYYIQRGESKSPNLIYIGNAPVLIPVEIKGGEHIKMGQTTLAFAPFCGEKFDWSDSETAAS